MRGVTILFGKLSFNILFSNKQKLMLELSIVEMAVREAVDFSSLGEQKKTKTKTKNYIWRI